MTIATSARSAIRTPMVTRIVILYRTQRTRRVTSIIIRILPRHTRLRLIIRTTGTPLPSGMRAMLAVLVTITPVILVTALLRAVLGVGVGLRLVERLVVLVRERVVDLPRGRGPSVILIMGIVVLRVGSGLVGTFGLRQFAGLAVLHCHVACDGRGEDEEEAISIHNQQWVLSDRWVSWDGGGLWRSASIQDDTSEATRHATQLALAARAEGEVRAVVWPFFRKLCVLGGFVAPVGVPGYYAD
jgi:hypothetical protein